MIPSLLRRILYAIFLLWIISIITFWLSRQVPGDAVMDYISIDEGGVHTSIDPVTARQTYERVARKRGLDLPAFYFSIAPTYIPVPVNSILPFDDRKAVRSWIELSKNGKASIALYHKLKSGLLISCGTANKKNTDDRLCQFYNQSLNTFSPEVIRQNAITLQEHIPGDSAIAIHRDDPLSEIIQAVDVLLNDPAKSGHASWFPQFNWHGKRNQYHQWMSSLLLQQPLISLIDGRDAWTKIYDALKWTLWLNGLALILALLFGTAIGIWSATHDGLHTERIINWILFALFALPSFWLATLLIYFLASGEWISVFPAGGLGSYQAASNPAARLGILISHLFLPVTCLTLGSLAYVSRQMKQSMQHEFRQPYVASLKAFGIADKTIVNRHVIRNALFPLITIIGGSVPALLSGSLIIEVIFSIPGMGRLMFNSLLARDWPVVFPILMLGALITIISYILTDVIYKWADPRVKTLEI